MYNTYMGKAIVDGAVILQREAIKIQEDALNILSEIQKVEYGHYFEMTMPDGTRRCFRRTL